MVNKNKDMHHEKALCYVNLLHLREGDTTTTTWQPIPHIPKKNQGPTKKKEAPAVLAEPIVWPFPPSLDRM